MSDTGNGDRNRVSTGYFLAKQNKIIAITIIIQVIHFVSLLSCPRALQFYRTENQHPPGYSVAVVLKEKAKETLKAARQKRNYRLIDKRDTICSSTKETL